MQTCLHPGHAKGLLLRQQRCSVLPGRRRAGCLLAPLLISLLALCTAQPWQIGVTNSPMPLPLLPHVRQACHRASTLTWCWQHCWHLTCGRRGVCSQSRVASLGAPGCLRPPGPTVLLLKDTAQIPHTCWCSQARCRWRSEMSAGAESAMSAIWAQQRAH